MVKSIKINETRQKLREIENTLTSFDEKKVSDCKFKDWSKIVDFKYEIINLKKDWGNALPTSIVEIINRVEPKVENIYLVMKEILKKRDDEYAKKVSDGILNGLRVSGKVGIGIVKGMGLIASALLADNGSGDLRQNTSDSWGKMRQSLNTMGERWHDDISQAGERMYNEQSKCFAESYEQQKLNLILESQRTQVVDILGENLRDVEKNKDSEVVISKQAEFAKTEYTEKQKYDDRNDIGVSEKLPFIRNIDSWR